MHTYSQALLTYTFVEKKKEDTLTSGKVAPRMLSCCKVVSDVQSALYFHTSVESDLHFKATQRGIRRRNDGRGKEEGKRKRKRGPWLSFDLIFIKQENIKVK